MQCSTPWGISISEKWTTRNGKLWSGRPSPSKRVLLKLFTPPIGCSLCWSGPEGTQISWRTEGWKQNLSTQRPWKPARRIRFKCFTWKHVSNSQCAASKHVININNSAKRRKDLRIRIITCFKSWRTFFCQYQRPPHLPFDHRMFNWHVNSDVWLFSLVCMFRRAWASRTPNPH